MIFISLFVSVIAQTVQLMLKCTKDLLYLTDKTKMVLTFSLCYQMFFLAYCITGNPLYDLETVYVILYQSVFRQGYIFSIKKKLQKSTGRLPINQNMSGEFGVINKYGFSCYCGV